MWERYVVRGRPAPARAGPGEHHTHTLTRLGDATHARPAPRARRTPAPAFPPIAEPRRAPSQHARHPARRAPRQAKAQTTGRWSLKASAGSGSARDAGTRHPPEQGGPGEAAHTAAAVAARREREKRLTLTQTHQGVGRRTGGEPQTHLGRLQRVVLPVKRDRSADNPNSPCDYFSCAPEE